MKKVSVKDAQVYNPPKHFGMTAMRLHNGETTGCKHFWMGLSHFLPAGGAEADASPTEKVYFVLAGEITVKTAQETVVLGPMDSLYIPPHEQREIINNTKMTASMLVLSSNE